jgi:hypothetical protein
MSDPIHVISIGAGVQSSTMALMAAAGEITPMPVGGIFADTQAEPKSVYAWLDWLEKQLPFPVHRVTKGNLADRSCEVGFSKKNNCISFSSIPAFVKGADGYEALIPRQCTRDFKIDPITKEINAIRRKYGNCPAYQWVGISTDEIYRAKEHRNAPRIKNRWPLMEKGFSRQACLAWMASRKFPTPPRSACVFCPYHNDTEWRRLKELEPKEFNAAVEFERRFQMALSKTKLRGTPFLHRSCKPLSEVDFSTEEERGQLNMFNNECEGMCGV